MVSNKTLSKIAVFGGFGAVTAVMYMRDSLISKFKKEPYYVEAMKCLRAHRGSVQLLGEPIKDSGIDLTDTDNFTDGKQAHLKVKVKGPNERGTMFLWADRPDIKTSWTVKRIELELKNQPDKRLIVKKSED